MKYIKTYEQFINESVGDNTEELKDMKKFGQNVSKVLKSALHGNLKIKDKIVSILLSVVTPFDSDIDMETPDLSDYDVTSIGALDGEDLEDYESELESALKEFGSVLQDGLKEAMKESNAENGNDNGIDPDTGIPYEDDDEDDEDEDSYVASYKIAKGRFDKKADKIKEIFKSNK